MSRQHLSEDLDVVSVNGPIIVNFNGVDFTEANFRETIVYRGQALKRHRYGGGWVPVLQDETDTSRPFVDEDAYVGPWAYVTGNARIDAGAVLTGNVHVFGNVKVLHGAHVCGTICFGGNLELTAGEWR